MIVWYFTFHFEATVVLSVRLKLESLFIVFAHFFRCAVLCTDRVGAPAAPPPTTPPRSPMETWREGARDHGSYCLIVLYRSVMFTRLFYWCNVYKTDFFFTKEHFVTCRMCH